MDEELEAFAARRNAQQDRAIGDFSRLVREWLQNRDDEHLDALILAAGALWFEIFAEIAPDDAIEGTSRVQYLGDLRSALGNTTDLPPDGEIPAGQLDRVATFIAVGTLNSATRAGTLAAGVPRLRWVSMRDADVRETHVEADGQVRSVLDTFLVGGARLRYPGDPLGPLDEILNCRCVLAPVRRGRRRSEMKVDTTAFEAVDELEEVDIEDEDLVDDVIDEIPVHGVAAIEGSPTGDGRQFAEGALTVRDLPVPLRYEIVGTHGGNTSDVVTVGRVDEVWREGNEMRWRGVVVAGRPYAADVISGLADGTVRGVSIDADDIEVEMPEADGELDIEAIFEPGALTVFSHARIAGLTAVPIPAFQEAFMALGEAFDDELSEEDLAALQACGCMGNEDDGDEFAISERAWDGSASRFTDEEWFRSTIVHTNGDSRVKGDNRLPIREPNGDLSRAGVHAAAARINQVDATPEQIASAERELRAAYAELGEDPPEVIQAAATFAPGTKDGGVGTLEAWSNLTSGPRRSSTTDQKTTSAGIGPATSTEKATAEWPWTGMVESARLIASSTSDESGRSPKGSSSTTSVRIGDASTHDTSNPSLTEPTSIAATRTTEALVASAGMGFTTSPIRMRGTSGLSMEFSDGRVVPVTSMDAENGIVKLSDDTVLVAQQPLGRFAPGTRDGPGWITNPRATARIRRYWTHGQGAAKIRWGQPGDFNRCRRQLAKYVQNPEWLAGTCANMHKEALGFWPGQERTRAARVASASVAPPLVLTASATERYPAEFFENPHLEQAVGMRIEGRRIFGYLAEWGVCHIGIPGVCSTAPHSSADYAYFLKGVVDTDRGEQRVGTLTYGIGHADIRMRASAATAHYDQADAVRAYVNLGEDTRGIWYSGVIAPWVTDQQIDALRGIGALSGDWRDVRGNGALELVGAVAVNTPGFPMRPALAASGGHQTALISAGAIRPEVFSIKMDAETIAGIARAAVEEYRHLEKREERLEKLKPIRVAARAERIQSIRSRIPSEKE